MISTFRNRWKPCEERLAEIRGELETLFRFASDSRNAGLLEEARRYYDERVGRAFEDDADYIQRMNSFLEWFIFDFMPLSWEQGIIFKSFAESRENIASPAEKKILSALAGHTHSLFIVKERRGKVVKVRDIIHRQTGYITTDDILEPDDLLESRIIEMDGACFFSYTHCLHPKAALRFVRKEIKRKGRKHITPDFFLKVAEMQLRWRRSRNIALNRIYSFRKNA